MFRSRKVRRRNRSKSTLSRGLVVELMEGRMMLSATGAETPQPVLDLTQFSFWPSKFRLPGAYSVLGAGSTDAGYANVSADTSSVVELWHPDTTTLTTAGTPIRYSVGISSDYTGTRGSFHLRINSLLDSS